MNSLTPIASLSETMISMLDQYAQSSKQLNDENISDLQYSLEMIGKRSNSMINFLEEYRRITRVPKPVLEEVDLLFFFEQIKHLTAKEISEEGITLNLEPIKAILYIDQGQIELVFLNLIKNCRQALANTPNPKIIINARKKGNQIIIEVNDNGAGIEPKVQGQIFVPFFTTKEAGSGIGLSLSRQILKLHRAYIHLRQSSSSGTSFELVFPVNNASIIEN
jgi:signal transduction histidine kinase